MAKVRVLSVMSFQLKESDTELRQSTMSQNMRRTILEGGKPSPRSPVRTLPVDMKMLAIQRMPEKSCTHTW